MNFYKNDADIYYLLKNSELYISIIEIEVNEIFMKKLNNMINSYDSIIYLENLLISSQNLALCTNFIKVLSSNLTFNQFKLQNISYPINNFFIFSKNSNSS